MLRDALKSEIDKLSESQLSRLVELIDEIKIQAEMEPAPQLKKDEAATLKRLQHFQDWVDSRPAVGISLSDEACDRANIYE